MEEAPMTLEEETMRSILKIRKQKSSLCSKYLDAILELEKKKLDSVKPKEKVSPLKLRRLPPFPPSDDPYDDAQVEKEIRLIAAEMEEILEINRIVHKNYFGSSTCYVPHTMKSIEEDSDLQAGLQSL